MDEIDCNHAVGLSIINHDTKMIFADGGKAWSNSEGLTRLFNYCPDCGEHVFQLSAQVDSELYQYAQNLRKGL